MSNYWGFTCLSCADDEQAICSMDRINRGQDTLLAMVRVSRALASLYVDLDLDVQVDGRWVPLAWLIIHGDHDLAIEGSYAGDLIRIPKEEPMNAAKRTQTIAKASKHMDAAEHAINGAATVPPYVKDLLAAVKLLVEVAIDDTPKIARALTDGQRQQQEGGF